MPTLLIKNIEMLVTMDDQRRELPHTNLYIKDGFIHAIGALKDMPEKVDQELDLSGHIVFPGLSTPITISTKP
jgi:8-oxoguanine deaminase